MYVVENFHIADAEQLLIDGNHFDKERLDFIKRLDSCDLLAVPGSGKTTALQAKLFCLSKLQSFSTKDGILVLSHTHAAVDEIKKKLSLSCPNLFQHPNFIGTVQDFVDTFLAIPYYNNHYKHPISWIDSEIFRDELKKDIQRKWINKNKIWSWYKFNSINQALEFGIKFSTDGKPIYWNYSSNKPFEVAPNNIPKTWKGSEEVNRAFILNILVDLKKKILQKGILSYDDCYALAQKYIYVFPRIKSILRARFKFVFIDETQDLQEHQLDLVNQLFCDDSVCYQRIGDVNQSIFHEGSHLSVCAWNPQRVINFNNSLRLSSSVGSVVDAFMLQRESNQTVNGVRPNQPVIGPYLFIYDYEHRDMLKRKFEELIDYYQLKNVPESKYGFHIIGWNSKWPNNTAFNPQNLRLFDLFPEQTSGDLFSAKYAENVADYMRMALNFSDNHERTSWVHSIICECLRKCGMYDRQMVKGKQCNRIFSPTSMMKYLEEFPNNLILSYKLKVLSVVKLLVQSRFSEAYNQVKDLANWLLHQISVQHSQEYKDFMNGTYIPPEVGLLVEASDDIQIETIHKAKGKTHCATLYVETMYEKKYESQHVLNCMKKKATKTKPTQYFSNPFYKEIGDTPQGAYARRAMKMVYVGLSRPTHLMCYAMHASSYAQYDHEKLKACGWNIIDLTIHA